MSKLMGVTNGEITSGQIAKLLYLFTTGSAALVVPPAIIAIAKQDAWITMLLFIPLHFLIIYIYLLLYERFPKLSIAQYSEKIVGRWIGKVVTLSFVFFFIVLSSLVLRNITDFLGKSFLPLTPDWFLGGTFMLVIAYGVYQGIETIARTGEILFLWTLAVVLFIGFMLMNQMQLENFPPVLANGWIAPIKGVYPGLGFPLAESVFLTILLPLVMKKDRVKLKRSIGWSVAITGIVGLMSVSLLIAVLGVPESIRSPFAVFEMARSINIEEIIVRVEVLYAMVWIATVFMKLALTTYSASVIIGQMLGLGTYRPLVLPISALIVPLAMIIYRNSAHATVFAMDVWTVYCLWQCILLPLMLLFIAAVFRKRSNADGRFPEKAPARSESKHNVNKESQTAE